LWVKPGDVAGWREAFHYILDHPNEAAQMGQRARALCLQRYNLQAFTAHLAKVIRSVAQS
jgi:glycosyltransferase involved in cell wall biosynthesis